MPRKNIQLSRNLRKNQTDAENKLWSVIRNRQISGVKSRRQFPLGRYIVDFYCPQYRIGIEADVGHHYEEKGRKRDEVRTQVLNELGVELIRFSDHDILTNIDAVFEVIQQTIQMRRGNSPHLNPLPKGKRR